MTLAAAQLRIARRVAKRLRLGELVFVIGADVRRRRDFEQALVDEGVKVARGRLALDADPWAQIVALARGGATPCVSWGEGPGLDSFLATLNLGRERFTELQSGLLMWIGGLDAIEHVPSAAPDLWAYRSGVEWVVSLSDFGFGETLELYGTELPQPADKLLAQHEHVLAGLPGGDPRRVGSLCSAILYHIRRERFAEVYKLWTEAEHIRSSGALTAGGHVDMLEANWFMARVFGLDAKVPRSTKTATFATILNWTTILITQGHLAEAGSMTAELQRSADARPLFDRGSTWQRLLDLKIVLGRLQQARELGRMYLDRVPEFARASWTWLMWLAAVERSLAIIAHLQLRPLEAMPHAVRAHALVQQQEDAAVAVDDAVWIVDRLRALGLTADAHAFTRRIVMTPDFSERRKLLLRVADARILIASGAHALGIDELWRAFDDSKAAIPNAHRLARAELALVALDLLRSDLIYLASTPSEADELRERGLAIARTTEQTATQQTQLGHAARLRESAAGLLRELGRTREAVALLEQNLAYAQQHEGPSLICRRHLVLAGTHANTKQLDRAIAEVDRAQRALERADPEYQPRQSWCELLLTRANIVAALGQPERARALALEARDRMAATGLVTLQLDAVHQLAQGFEHEGPEVLDAREQAAAEALALAAPSGLIDEEARALANFARVHAERGRPEPAAAMLAEAQRLLANRPYGPLREHIDRVAAAITAR